MSQKQTKFEQDLEAYFPDVYKIHTIGKWDKYIWAAWDTMLEMVDTNSYGEIVIKYNRGRIERITKSEDRLGGKQHSPYLNHPGELD